MHRLTEGTREECTFADIQLNPYITLKQPIRAKFAESEMSPGDGHPIPILPKCLPPANAYQHPWYS